MSPYLDTTFSSSRSCFDALVDRLEDDETAHLSHGEVERLLEVEGRELLRRLMQDHMDLRAMRERVTIEPMRAADGVRRTEKRRSSRVLGTLFGVIGVHRIALVKRGVSGGLRPLDAELNLPVGKYSEGVGRRLAREVAQCSHETALENLRRTTGAKIAKRQAEELAVRMAGDFEAFYLDQPVEAVGSAELLVLSFDGCGVVMLPEALRPETRKRAIKGRRRSTAETAAATRDRSEKRNRKRMAEVATVYDLEVVPRTPEDVLRELRKSGPHKPRPRAKNKRVWASLDRPVPAVIDDAFLEACRRDEDYARHWVAIVDGNAEQIHAINTLAGDYGVQVTLVVDFIHVLGYLWKAGKALVGKDPAEVDAWVSERALRILRGEASVVAGGMTRSATNRGLGRAARKPVDECARYLLNHKRYLHYDEYLRKGLPIASGVIEGACRSLVKDRMDITGARWGLEGGEAVLKLRSLRASGDLDDYLAYHARKELERNHLDKFDGGELLDLRDAA